MPRSLARLRYRTPSLPVNLAALELNRPSREEVLEGRVAEHVIRQSNPRHLKLQTVVNAKSRLQATGKFVPPPWKPHTLRDLVDPEEKARHGEILYIFRNNKTNQIIYSLQELLDDHHLAQLPFIGKHSKPPTIRPPEWVPHCVVTFPTAEQGHNAFRRLREFRKLHEIAWQKTNPEYKFLPAAQRVKKIMDQRANTSADLAAVLHTQELDGQEMAERSAKLKDQSALYIEERWEYVRSLAAAADAKKQVADNPKWLQHQIRSLGFKLKMKHNQNEADQKRLKTAKTTLENRLQKIQYAQRKVSQWKQFEEAPGEQAAMNNNAGAESETDALKLKIDKLQAASNNPDATRSDKQTAADRRRLERCQARLAELEQESDQQISAAKSRTEDRELEVTRSILPLRLRMVLPTPFTLDGVSVQWADIQDALYAAGQWPESVEHETLALNKAYQETSFVSAQDFQYQADSEISQILEAIGASRESNERLS